MQLIPIKANMTQLNIGEYTILFSYRTPVAFHRSGSGYFKTEKKWSATTSRHINLWLHGANAESVPQDEIDAILENV